MAILRLTMWRRAAELEKADDNHLQSSTKKNSIETPSAPLLEVRFPPGKYQCGYDDAWRRLSLSMIVSSVVPYRAAVDLAVTIRRKSVRVAMFVTDRLYFRQC